MVLVVGEVGVLWDGGHLAVDVLAEDAEDGGVDVFGAQLLAAEVGFDDDIDFAVPCEYFYGDAWVALCGVGEVGDGSGEAVAHLVGVVGVDFFKHVCGGFYGFNLGG